jgi:large subunit ribosomal protein L21
MFAVIKTGGKQYKVAANDLLRIEKLQGEAGDAVAFSDVLMLGEGDKITVGSPLVDGAMVAGELVGQIRDKKIIVFKKKRRKGYRRKAGHRQQLSVVRITEILAGGAKPKAPAKSAAKPAPKSAAKPSPSKTAEPAKAAPRKAPAKPIEKPATTSFVDDVKLISGVGPALEKKLAAAGVTSLKQIAEFTAADIERVDAELNFKGRIERDDWIGQAKKLIAGK